MIFILQMWNILSAQELSHMVCCDVVSEHLAAFYLTFYYHFPLEQNDILN